MPLHEKQSQQPRNTHGTMRKKLTNNTESYYGPLASMTLALSTVPTRKVVDGSLKDQSVRTKRSELLDQVGTRNQVKKNKPRIQTHSESLYMMEVSPPYERRFEVINWHEAAVVISTKYWTVIGQPLQRMLKYDSDVTAQKEAETVVLRTCYDPRHGDKPQHSYDVYGRKNYVITNIEQSQALFQMSDSQNDQTGPQEEEPSIQNN